MCGIPPAAASTTEVGIPHPFLVQAERSQ